MRWPAIFGRKSAPAVTERTVTARDIALALMGRETKSNIFVTPSMALQVSAFFACVRVRANGIATPRLRLMRARADGRGFEPAEPGLQIEQVLSKRPNPWQTSFQFRHMMETHRSVFGNCYAFINRVDGEIQELLPLHPRQVQVEQLSNYEVVYRVTDLAGRLFTLPASSVFHLTDVTVDGFKGINPITVGREVLALAMGLEESQATLHANGGRPSGILSSDVPAVSPEMIQKVREAWMAAFSGNRRGGVAVLDAGFKFTPMSMTAVDAQHLETRRFQIEEICRIMNVFPQMIMHTTGTMNFASVEAFFSAHDLHTMKPLRRAWEEKIDAQLLDGADGSLEAKFEEQPMMYMSARDRALLARTEMELGAITRNEYREATGRPPLAGLDEPLTPMNMNRGTLDDDHEPEKNPEPAA